MSKKIKVLLFTCVLAIICCMGFTVGATDEVKAEVKGHSLTITDTGISVNFYVDIPSIEGVQVTLNENEVDLSTMQTEEIVIDAKAYDCYIFTGEVAAKEMDDKVTLSIAAGQEEPVTDRYSVNDYVEEVQKGGYNYNFETLANAMTYYGEFAEVYFGYKGATSVSTNANSYIGAVTESDFDSYAASVHATNMPDGLEFYGTMLNLNSKTTLRLLFTVTDKEASSFGTFTANGEDLGELKPYKTYYYVDIEGIGAAQLDKAYTIQCGGAEIISNCSVLTYARAAVKSTKDSLVNLSKALYLYNQKANTYVEAQSYAVYDMFYGNDGFSATPGTRTPIYLTGDGDVTRQAEGNTEIRTLEQLSGSRTKGASVWMETEYTVSETEELSGPYVIRRYTGNEGNVLNVTGTATLKTTVNGSNGQFVAQYPNATEEGKNVSFDKVDAGEVSVSGTLNVTGSAKTGVITVASGATANIVANDLVSEDQVILASHKGVNLSGNADVSSIKLLDDGMGHFDVVKQENNVRIASVICVCGKDVTGKTSHVCPWTENVDNIEKVYDIAWEPHTGDDGKLPGHFMGGYYYLTNAITLTERTEVSFETCVDLNGQIVTGWNGRNIGVKGADYSIADSKGGAAIKLPEGYNYSSAYGGMIGTMGAYKLSIYGGTIDMSATSTVSIYNGNVNDELHLIDLASGGTLEMHGGSIIPAQDGKGFGIRNGHIVATGGTIYGEILCRNANEDTTITVGDDAKVGVVGDEGDWLHNITHRGINAWYATALMCDNLNENAKIDIKSRANITLSELENSDSLVSALNLLDDGYGHFDVLKQDGNLRFASVVCVCGEDVTGKTSHNDCPWVQEKEGSLCLCGYVAKPNTSHENCPWAGKDGISKVYDIPWVANEQNTYMPGSSTKGYYYLTDDITLTNPSQITSTGTHLDLSGKKITLPNTSSICIHFNVSTGRYSISDSKGKGAIQLPSGFQSSTTGAVMMFNWSGAYFTMYGGTIDMSEGTVTATAQTPIDIAGDSGVDFIMYGGEIIPAKDGRSLYVRRGGRVKLSGDAIVHGEISLNDNYETSPLQFIVGEGTQVGTQWGNCERYGIVRTSSDERQIICNNLNENANIVIKSKTNLSLIEKDGSNSLASVFTVVDEGEDGHFGVVKKSNGDLAFATTICVCGENVSDKPSHTCAWVEANSMAAVYGLDWQAHTSSGVIPVAAGYYYLTSEVTITAKNSISTTTHMDLNGHKVICASQNAVNIGTTSGDTRYSVSDSKGNGAIQFNAGFESGYNGAMIQLNYSGATFTMYSGTIDMTNGTVSTKRPIELAGDVVEKNGCSFIVYGGEIKPDKNGYSVHVRGCSHLNVFGNGSVYGRVVLNPKYGDKELIRVGGNAKVGSQWEDNAVCGIYQDPSLTDSYSFTKKIVCNNLNEDAQVVIMNKANLVLEENGNSVLTGIKAEDGHFGVIKENGSLCFVSVICVCGDDVTGKDSHSCAWTGTEKGIADVHDINWTAYNATSGVLPGGNEAGFYYLTNNLTANTTDVDVESYLDLNGYTATLANGQYWVLRILEESGKYSVTDSKRTGTIQFPENYDVGAWGAMIKLQDSGTFHMYGGTIDMTKAKDAEYSPIEIYSGHLFMHGGVIKGAQNMVVCPEDGKTTYTNCIRARGTGTVTATGGSIFGEILLQTSANTLTVSGAAQVGLATEDIVGNGIKAWADNTPIISTDLADNAKVVFSSDAHLQLTEGFELVDKDGELLLQRKVAE